MNDIRGCASPKCDYTTRDYVATCPRCGGPMRVGMLRPFRLTAKQQRRLGWVFVSLGLFLVAFVGILAVYLAPSLLHPGATGYEPAFNVTAGEGKLTCLLFGVLILFGVNATIAGIFAIRTGRPNKWTLVLGAVLLFVFFCVLVTYSIFVTN